MSATTRIKHLVAAGWQSSGRMASTCPMTGEIRLARAELVKGDVVIERSGTSLLACMRAVADEAEAHDLGTINETPCECETIDDYCNWCRAEDIAHMEERWTEDEHRTHAYAWRKGQ